MRTDTSVEVLIPRQARAEGITDDSLPLDLTVQVGTGGAAVPGSVTLQEFLAGAGTLTHAERLLIVDQALVLIQDNYVHLQLKTAMHAVSPVQRLRLLRARLERQTDETMAPERVFHAKVSAVFHSVRDLHTNYLLPTPFAGMIAYLPFQVERCLDGSAVTYLVTRLAQGLDAPPFGTGVEVTHWNGMPVERAVTVNADRFSGSNHAARMARGVESLTIRSLRLHLPPDEEWVTVTYVGADGLRRELREPWLVAPNLPAAGRRRHGLDRCRVDGAGPARRRGRKSPEDDLRARGRRAGTGRHRRRAVHRARRARRAGELHDARRLPRPQRRHQLRHLRPRADLHLQRRGPGRLRRRVRPAGRPAAGSRPDPRRPRQRGGHIHCQRVHPPDAHAAADHPCAAAVRHHVAQPRDLPAARDQPHAADRPGSVVRLDGAVRGDRGGLLLGVRDHAGGGGQRHRPALRRPRGPRHRRPLRVGPLAGTPVEDLGVRPDVRHDLTRRDVLAGNLDLLDRAGKLLAKATVRRLATSASLDPDGTLTLEVDGAGLDRLDAYVDGRPRASADLGDGHQSITVAGVHGATTVHVEGYAGGELVAARTDAL